jgi:cytochrome c peroxidase
MQNRAPGIGRDVTRSLKNAALVSGSLAAFLAVVVSASAAVASPANNTTRSIANFATWVGRYKDEVGEAPQSVSLHRIPGLSAEDSTATGRVTVNLDDGAVIVNVDGLLPPELGTAYSVLLVDNKPGPGNSVALDRGPGGDDLIDLGALAFHGTQAGLEAAVNPQRLRDFELDMVVVTRRHPSGSEEIVIGGLFSVVQKIAARDRQDHLLAAHAGLPRPSLFGFFSTLLGELPWPPPAAATAPAQGNPGLTTLIDEGRTVFLQEQFNGNGRTCGTCHQPESNFTIDTGFISKLPANDPLFVAEFDPNLANLENPTLMRTKGLILENIDGFNKAPVFRGPPHVFNLSFTAPFGWSNNVGNLQDFCVGAVMQHLPKTLNRVAGVDFRTPTQEELDAMEAFQLSVSSPPDENFDLDALATSPAEQRGRALFFGPVAKCSKCHGGPALSDTDPSIRPAGGNQAFNTGVAKLINGVGCEALPKADADCTREFSTPTLFAAKATPPFFHDHAVTTLRDAVKFYDGVEFNTSPAAAEVGSIGLTNAQVDDITAFLNSLTPSIDIGKAVARPGGVACLPVTYNGGIIAATANDMEMDPSRF